MTVRLIATTSNYNGLSTDDKPDAPPEGSTFHAIDTGEHFIFHDGAWELDLTLSAALDMAL